MNRLCFATVLLLATTCLHAADSLEIVLVKDGKPVHNMYCRPNDDADPAAVLALKEYRTLVTKSPDGQANQVFGRRLRLGHPMDVRHAHNWHRIMSPDEYGKDHPEWFAEINGRRYPKHYSEKRGGQVCTSNPEVVEHFAKSAIEHFDENPRSQMFSIAANDGRKFCTCSKCLALDDGRVRPDGRRVTTDRIIRFSNQIAEKVQPLHPNKKLGVIIYLDYKYPPVNVNPHPMLFLVHPTNSGFSQGAGYEGDQSRFENFRNVKGET